MKLTVIIVNYNVCAYLRQCLDSVRRATQGIDAEVIVVDNASTDSTVQEITTHEPWVRLIANQENLGFSGANNQAIRQSTGEYVLLLNPDTIVGEETIHEAIAFLDHHPEAGALGTRMLKADGGFALESRRGVPTPFTAACKMLGLCTLFPKSRLFGRYYMRYLDENQPARIDIISGAYMMLRRTALNEVGLLDDTFFMYGEDIDISYRMLKGGWLNYYLPHPILHYKGESTQKTSFRYVKNFYNAMLIFYDKHFGGKNRLPGILIRIAIYLMGSIEYLLRQYYRLKAGANAESKWIPAILQREIKVRILAVGSPRMCEEIKNIDQVLLRNKEKKYSTTIDYIPCPDSADFPLSLPLGEINERLTADIKSDPSSTKTESRLSYTHIVIDTGLFRYEDILSFMMREGHRHRGLLLGTWSPQSGRLIFPQGVYSELDKVPAS